MRPTASPLLVAALAQLATIESEIGTIEETLKDKKALRKYIGEHVLAELVDHEHLNNGATLPDGTDVDFTVEYHASIATADKELAHGYLIGRGHGDLLKTMITVLLPRDELEKAALLTNVLKLLPGVDVDTTTMLPGATLMNFVKQTLQDGGQLPACFGVYAPVRATRPAMKQGKAPR